MTCFCKVCGRRFFRDGNDVYSSLSYSTPGGIERDDPGKSRTWRDWVIVMTTHCDMHLPPMPIAVTRDLEKENERRSGENFRLMKISQSEVDHVEGDGRKTIAEWKEMARWKMGG